MLDCGSMIYYFKMKVFFNFNETNNPKLGLKEDFYFVQKSSYILVFFGVVATLAVAILNEATARVAATPILF